MTGQDKTDRLAAAPKPNRGDDRREPPPLTLRQRLFNWLDSRISRWFSGGR